MESLLLGLSWICVSFLCLSPLYALDGLRVEKIRAQETWQDETGTKLVLEGGWTFNHEDETFGGFSALELFRGHLVSVSDRGHSLDLGSWQNWLEPTKDLKRQTLDSITWRPLAIDKSALQNRGAATDAESLALDRQGDLLVSFEREHRIQVHKNLTDPARTWEVPIALRRPAPLGFGIEAMTSLANGKIFAVSEKVRRDGGFRAYLIDGRRGQDRNLMVYEFEGDWLPSAAASLGSSHVLLIERQASLALLGFRSRLLLLKQSDLRPRARLKPRPLFTFGFSSLGADNLEGLTLRPRPDGAFDLWIISDDNFSPWQQNNLLKFVLYPSADMGLKP